jgi:hypothetical protein
MSDIAWLRSCFAHRTLMFAVDGEQFNQFVEAGPMRIAFVFDAYRYA